MARFNERKMACKNCSSTWVRHEEKETDVHFSLTFLEDALDDVFERAILISADSDYVPAIRKVRNRFPGKQIFVATPPNRHGHARDLLHVCNSGMPITAGRLAKNLLPAEIRDGEGALITGRPREYNPPA